MLTIDFEKFTSRSWEKIGIQGKNKTGSNVTRLLCTGTHLMMKYLNISITRCLLSKAGALECSPKFHIPPV